MLALAIAAQFYSDFGMLWAILPGLLILTLLMLPGRAACLNLLIAALASIVFATPGLIFHRSRIFSAESTSQLSWGTKILAHLSYLDGWFAPFLVIFVAGAILLVRIARGRMEFTPQLRITIGCITISILAAIVMAYPAPFPHVRYLIALMPLMKLALGVSLMGMYRSMLVRLPKAAVPVTLLCIAILITTNLASVPIQQLIDAPDSRTPDFCTASKPYLRCDLGGLFHELSHDFVSPDRIRANAAADLAERGETILTNYGDIPLMFHLPDMHLRGGVSGDVRIKEDGPDIILLHKSIGLSFRSYLDDLMKRDNYEMIKIAIPDSPYGNIAEPRAHYFATPEATSDFLVFVRKDHADRLAALPKDAAALLQRWSTAN
jgi:hypothetical protein